ncbi:MAG: PG0541 family transporter-associated protein [Chloroflexota bacterium]
MVQIDKQPAAIGVEQKEQSARAFYLILYPKELEDEVVQSLEATGVPGYTEMPKMIGRGRHVRHFDNAVWPGATGAIFTIVTPQEAATSLLPTFEALAASLETRSNGLYGIHIFALPCEQII